MLVVQTLGVLGLAVYCIETYRIRRSSQQQVETAQKPFVTFLCELRDGADVILEMGGAVGSLVARADQGSYVIHNVGNGVAINLRYRITRNEGLGEQPWRYMPAVPATSRVTLVETLGGYNANHVATFEYESIGGRKYRSTITLNHHVITAFNFGEISVR